ncbi:MAG: hypothetical protein LBG88_04065 [Christensenellaceae bacterium]|nr:hypothetical protein [Christensenellaceae bacterium]
MKKPSRNITIVISNIVTSSTLLFCCCFFFFRNYKMFGRDFTSYMAFMPVLFFAGVLYVCFYIIMLVGSLENNSTRNADRYDLAYRIVFSVTLFVLIIRSFLGDFMGEGTTLNVSYEIIIVAIVSGIATWLTPKIKDNDNTEF